MTSKKKKKKSAAPAKSGASSSRKAAEKIMPGTFGELLVAAKKKVETAPSLTERVMEKLPEPEPEPVLEEPAPVSDVDFFSKAIDELNSKDIYTGKFGRPEDAHWTPPRIVKDAPVVSVELVKQVQEIRYFQREVGQLQRRFKDGKYYVAEKHNIDESAQEAVLRRFERVCKGRSVPEVDLHNTTAKNVLEILEAFVLAAQTKGIKYIRVIHGKGKNSTGAPVLKPLVLQWLNTSSLCSGHAPLIEADEDFGLTIVELRRPNP